MSELRRLRYFLAVAEELHFGRAAERVGIAQPALSQQIRRLEEEVGVPLFHRTKRSVELTVAGRAMEPEARRALASVEQAMEVARRAARGEVGHLTVGFVETAATALVPQAVQRFRADFPGVALTLRELPVSAQLEGLHAGTLDVGIVRPPFDPAGLEIAQVQEEPFVVAVAASSELAARRRLSPRELAGLPLVLLAREVVPGLHDQVIGLLQEHGGATIAQEATSIQAVLGLVAAGLGASLVPDSVRTLERHGVAFVPLHPSPRSRLVAISRRADRSPLVARFVGAMERAVSAGG
jgi:DNA-binding transcriptional LysR family regulator